MRTFLLLSLWLGSTAVIAGGPSPDVMHPPAVVAAAPANAPAAAQAKRAPAARSGIAITVTDPNGATRPGIHVEVLGVSDRSGDTNDSGQINFTGMQAGTYRLRFSGDEVITFERELTLRANQTADVDVTLYDAPPPRVVTVEAEPPPAPEAPIGPLGEAQTLSVVDVLEDEFVGREPRRESLLSCSGNLRTTMIQLNDSQPPRLYDNADATYYVLAGEGTLEMDGRKVQLETNGFVSVPRGITHSFTRRGNRPFVLLATLGGAPCEQAK